MARVKVPVLQIIHYSDVHIVGKDYWKKHVATQQFIARLPATLRQGIVGADTAALRAFVDFLRDEIAVDPVWKNLPTWLIDTGDGTTFGDEESLESWLNVWSPRFLGAAGPNARQQILYGNHDAWPGTFPLQAPRSMDAKRDSLRQKWFADTWPAAPLKTQLFDKAEIQLYVLNSVDHTLWANAKALGQVLPDRFWEALPPQLGPTAASGLARCISSHRRPAPARDLRILAMHYPVCDAATPSKRLTELLTNRAPFAADIAPPAGASEPLVHLVMSGHTHDGYPQLGLLPNGAGSTQHLPLDTPQVQLVTPSLSQFNKLPPPTGKSHHADCLYDFPYQFSLLRFYAYPATPEEVSIERSVIGCAVGGAFGFLPISPGSQRTEEELTVVV